MRRTRAYPLATLALGLACSNGSADTEATVGATTTDATTADLTSSSSGDSSSSSSSSGAPTTTGSPTTGVTCPANAAPAAPQVVAPGPGRIDIIPQTLQIVGSAFVDPDGDSFGAVQAEIYRIKDGALSKRVWRAELTAAAPPALSLADGKFDDNDDTTLEDWKDHVVRLRYRDERGDCSVWSEWSDDLLFRTDDGSSALFDDSVVRDFYLEIPPESWQAINDQAIPPGCVPWKRSYYKGALRYEDQYFPGVGIKTKGGCGTSRSLNQKASFKIDLEWDDPNVAGCPADRRLLGENSLTFNNGVQDRTASHERLGYALFRELGIPAPRVAHVRLFVNGELWGLYQHIETIDRRFLARWFDSNDGMLYEGTYWCDLVPNNVPPTDDDDSYCITREFSPDPCSSPDPGADPLDYALVRQLVEQIEALPEGEFYPAVTAFFDFDRFLTTWALESVIDHWDNYAFSIQNNYRVYHDPTTGLWTLLPSGIDQTFNDEQDPWAVGGVLAARCIAEPACEAAFAARLAEVNEFFAASDLHTRHEAILDQITPYVEEDPRREYDMQSFFNRHAGLESFIDDRPDQVRQHLMNHGF